jgi:SAM-dependent methyltransferase
MAKPISKARLHHIVWRLKRDAPALPGRAATRSRRTLRDRLLRGGPSDWQTLRDDLAQRYLHGEGIEIGALNIPQRVPPDVRVRYVDHASGAELRQIYAHELALHNWPLVEPDVVDDGERLTKFADASLDFVIANHMLEHAEDPVETLHHFLRVLRPGGILFLTLPDARHTFDGRRPRTTIEHLLRDHREGPEVSRSEHYEQWARIVESVPEDRIAERVERFRAEATRNHFHVWELETFLAFLFALEPPADLVRAHQVDHEFAVILSKNPNKLTWRAWADLGAEPMPQEDVALLGESAKNAALEAARSGARADQIL